MQPLLELNPAESIFAAFHDEHHSPRLQFHLTPNSAHGFRSVITWDSTRLVWDDCPIDQPVGTATLEIDDLPDRFDHLIFCLVIPVGVTVQFEGQVDRAWMPLGESVDGTGERMEIVRPLPSANLTRIQIAIMARAGGPHQVALQWWGVGAADLRDQLDAARPRYDGRWEGLIHPAEDWETPRFVRGLLFEVEDLPALRVKAGSTTWKGHFDMLETRARESLDYDPLTQLGDYLPWSDHRYLRAREKTTRTWIAEPILCALVGLVRKDQTLIRHALHYLMCFVHTRHWCQSAENRARGSTWDQRCFLEEMSTTTCALLYDWLGYALTERARDLVRVALWDKGLSIIQRDMVKCEYVYTMNQGPWFCRARILAGLVLEADWPRVRPYTEQACADIREGMANYILPDGGVDEGVGYFSVTLQAVIPALLAYARARGKDIHEVLPPRLARSGNFVATMSAMDPGGVLMDGDNSNDRFTGDAMAILAGLYPDDVYKTMAAGTLLQLRGGSYYRQYMIDGPFAFIAAPDELPEPKHIVPVFGHLPDTGQLTSRRALPDGCQVRIHLAGCKALASHTHFDKGAFTLELDREPVLIDRGMCRYDDIRSFTLKRTELHNVLAPTSADGITIGQSSPEEAVIPQGSGDDRILKAQIDLSHVWREVMSTCVRELRSECPEELMVIDRGRLIGAHPLVFHLHTRQPWTIEVENRRAILEVGDHRITLETPWAAEIFQAEDSIDHRYEPVWHLQCRLPAGNCAFELKTHLMITNKP